MKIEIDLDTIVRFIEEFGCTQAAQSSASQAFLAAVADGIQQQSASPTTRSKKRKQDSSKTGDTLYEDSNHADPSTKANKRRKTDCRNAVTKDAAAPQRAINMVGCPDVLKVLEYRKSIHHASEPGECDDGAYTHNERNENHDTVCIPEDSELAVNEAMDILKKWKWPTMGRKPTWAVDGIPPAPTPLAARCLAVICTIQQTEHKTRLIQLIDELNRRDPVSTHGLQIKDMRNLTEINRALDRMQHDEAIQDYLHMRTLLHLILSVDQIKKLALSAGNDRCTMAQIADDNDVELSILKNRYKAGTRILYLAAGGGMWLLPIIAVLQMKARILYYNTDGREPRGTTNEDISGLAFVMRDPFEPDMTALVEVIANTTTELIDRYNGRESEWFRISMGDEEISFSDVRATDRLLNEIYISYFRLPRRQTKVWGAVMDYMQSTRRCDFNQELVFLGEGDEDIVEPTIRVFRLHIKLSNTASPVNKHNREAWSERERGKASSAFELQGEEGSYQAQLQSFFRKGMKPRNKYIMVNSGQLESDVIKFEDDNGAMIGILIRDISRTVQDLDKIIPQIQAIVPGALVEDNSRRPKYTYGAIHGQAYNRYNQKASATKHTGTGAPTDTHPHRLYIAGKKKNNPTQRILHYGRQVIEDPDRHEMLRNVFKPLTSFLRDRIKALLPKEYDVLERIADNMMMNEDSTVHPMTGFVLNFRACSSGHRDTSDLLMCVVIPFGQFEGGELCLFEPGLMIRMLSWDAFIFKSGDITHFNMHYEGLRGSLVLHTDKDAASYVEDYNGWGAHIAK